MRTVIGLLSDAREAKRTADDLEKIGARDISIISKDGSSTGPLASYLAPSGGGGSTTTLESMGVPRAEAQRYLDGLKSGYTLEAATIDDDKAEQALAIMKQHAIGFEGKGTKGDTGLRSEGEAVLPVIAEELRIGKREVGAGGVRVTSTVQEIPVEEQVELREEKVDVERRAVDRPIGTGEEAFREQTFEVTAKAEEAVVTKEARVVEEVVVRKGAETKNQTISETVRRQDVNVEQLGSRYGEHFEENYASRGDAKFDEYAPAYQYGYDLRGNRAYANRQWDEIEPNVRDDWEKSKPGTWDRVKAAVRHAWGDVKS